LLCSTDQPTDSYRTAVVIQFALLYRPTYWQLPNSSCHTVCSALQTNLLTATKQQLSYSLLCSTDQPTDSYRTAVVIQSALLYRPTYWQLPNSSCHTVCSALQTNLLTATEHITLTFPSIKSPSRYNRSFCVSFSSSFSSARLIHDRTQPNDQPARH